MLIEEEQWPRPSITDLLPFNLPPVMWRTLNMMSSFFVLFKSGDSRNTWMLQCSQCLSLPYLSLHYQTYLILPDLTIPYPALSYLTLLIYFALPYLLLQVQEGSSRVAAEGFGSRTGQGTGRAGLAEAMRGPRKTQLPEVWGPCKEPNQGQGWGQLIFCIARNDAIVSLRTEYCCEPQSLV